MIVSASPRQSSNSAPFIPALFGHIGAVEKITISSSDHSAIVAILPHASKKRGRPKIVHINSLKACLSAFSAPGFALARLPHLDHIVTGAVNLDMAGNTRPLSKKLMVRLLQHLDVISTEAVKEYMHLTLRQCSERHAQKIALCLRVIENTLAPIAKTKWLAPNHTYEIESCGKDNCPVCSVRSAFAAFGKESPNGDFEVFDVEFIEQTEEILHLD